MNAQRIVPVRVKGRRAQRFHVTIDRWRWPGETWRLAPGSSSEQARLDAEGLAAAQEWWTGHEEAQQRRAAEKAAQAAVAHERNAARKRREARERLAAQGAPDLDQWLKGWCYVAPDQKRKTP